MSCLLKAAFHDDTNIGTDTILCTSIKNELEYHYLYVRFNSSNDQAKSVINLVGFRPVPPEFNCVEQASISDWVSISTFAT